MGGSQVDNGLSLPQNSSSFIHQISLDVSVQANQITRASVAQCCEAKPTLAVGTEHERLTAVIKDLLESRSPIDNKRTASRDIEVFEYVEGFGKINGAKGRRSVDHIEPTAIGNEFSSDDSISQ
ncbi:hypothetical protein Pla52n_68770 [Stieleria varia]|uniref:Uncharacterized protein n=1 Tax=Stieleria varia TaxID=2528005 RepID=A0A5C5ZSQ1_9BACT|nr:hypothetical protein Pla52n_68770 [Stieleria varia]